MKPNEAPVPKKRQRGRPIGTIKGAKVAVTIMLPVVTKERLDAISQRTGVNRGAFIDQALQAKFKRDGIT
jgi:hypothetical protein